MGEAVEENRVSADGASRGSLAGQQRGGSGEAPPNRSSGLPGPFSVGAYARKLQREMRKRARVQLIGEVTGVSRSKVQAYFELRDGRSKWLYPGFNADWSNQPYFVIRQAKATA